LISSTAIPELHVGALQAPSNRKGRADAHDRGIDADDARRYDTPNHRRPFFRARASPW
jgi:hypothetical protein